MKKTLLSLFAAFAMAATASAQVTFTCTEGQKFGDNEGSDKVFDGNVNTKWCTDTGNDDGSYALFYASEAINVWGYKLTTANDNELWGRELRAWELYGTNDEAAANDKNSSAWVSLSKYTNSGVIAKLNFHEQLFYTNAGASKTAYKYFKFVIRDSGFFQFSELSLCYNSKPALEYNWVEGSNDNTKKMVDMSISSKMEGNNIAGNWVIIETEDQKPHTMKSYAISTNDDGEWSNRAPKRWTVEGSNDKENWTLIDKVENDPIKNQDGTTFEFPVKDVDAAYRYVKFTMDEMKGTGWTQIGEFHVFGTCEVHNWVMTAGKEATCVEDGGAEYTCSECGIKKLTGVIPATGIHKYVDGHCTMCNRPDLSAIASVDGYCQPTTVADFELLAEIATFGDVIKVRLAQDVDLTGFAGFSIGDDATPFKGEFDGQGKTITGLNIKTDAKNVALFGKTEDANIHDLNIVDAKVVISGNKQNAGVLIGNAKNTTVNRVAISGYVEGYDHVGSFVGNVAGGTTISNSMSSVEVVSRVYQAAGFVGTSSGVTIDKSIFTGTVKGQQNSGGFISLLEGESNTSAITNSIMVATQIYSTSNGSEASLAHGNGRSGNFTNNYVSANTIFKTDKADASAEHKAGETREYTNANDINGLSTADKNMQCKSFLDETMGWDMTNDWKMVAAGQWPVLAWMDAETAQTVQVTEAGYATAVAEAELTIPEGVNVYAAQIKGEYVHLEPITGSIPAGEAVVVKGTGSVVLPYAVEYADEVTGNELVAATDDVEADGSQYVLAKPEGEEVGFYQATTGTIEAGKGYLVMAAGVKAYLFESETATGISNANANANSEIYNLAGQKMTKMQKGINIVNGVKVLK